MIRSSPLLRRSYSRCLLCNSSLTEKDKKPVHQARFNSIRETAELWSQIDERVCKDDPYMSFREVLSRLPNELDETRYVHKSCCITFRNKVKLKQAQSNKLREQFDKSSEHIFKDIDECTESTSEEFSQRQRRDTSGMNTCFVCNIRTSQDRKTYRQGGLSRCSEQTSANKLRYSLSKKIVNEADRYYEAAKRLDIYLSGVSHDIFAADVYYHKKCYNAFTYSYQKRMREATANDDLKGQVLEYFNNMFRRRVIEDQESYLMRELLNDIEEISQDFELQVPPMKFTSTLKAHLSAEFGDSISFSMLGKNQVVHSSALGPVTYVEAVLKGHGMREDDLTKAFARLLKRKLVNSKSSDWPPTPEQVYKSLENLVPLSCIFNAIAWSVNPNSVKNDLGLVKVGKSSVEKITAIAESWEALVTGNRAPLNIALSLTVHRLTGSKETAKLLHHAGFGISYDDIRMLNNTWANSVKIRQKHMLPPGFTEGKTIHVTFDNSDGKQQTLTGSCTTHHTTGTVFQIMDQETAKKEETSRNPAPEMSLVDDEPDYGSYKIPKKRKDPPILPNFTDGAGDSPLIEEALIKDVAWVVSSTFGVECAKEFENTADVDTYTIGSWTNFMRQVTRSTTKKCKLEFLPVIPLPPGDNVIKWYMDSIMQMVDDLATSHVFVHADEAITSKLLTISWLHEGKYDKIISLMGGFHTILVSLKILGKKFSCLGLKSWWVDSSIIAEGSAEKALDGRHYHRSVRLHKQSFEALLRYKLMKLTTVDGLQNEMKICIANLVNQPSAATLAALIQQPDFKHLFKTLLSSTGAQADMIVQYIRDVSSMLCLISSVRENAIERHLAAERVLIPKCFAFGHPNYARYLSYQHVRLFDIKTNHTEIWEDLVRNGFGGSTSGSPFSTIHGDLITETTINREVKVRGGPMHGGFSTDERAVDTFVKTSHITARLRVKLKERLNVITKSSHKETTKRAKQKHEAMIHSLVSQLEEYFNPFLDGPARNFKTGAEIYPAVVEGLLSSTKKGTEMFKDFVEKRLMTDGKERVSIFAAISNPKIKTGLEKAKKVPKIISVLKEDRQAFGSLIGKDVSPEEALAHPLTSLPLALASPDGDLRHGSKASLRNHLIEESDAVTYDPAVCAFWLFDGMAVVRSVPRKQTWGEYAKAFIDFCTPKKDTHPLKLGIIFDCYTGSNTKQLTQLRRGEPGKRFFITSSQQSMPTCKQWDDFFHNPENKTELIHFLVMFMKENRHILKVQMVVTENEKTWLLSSTTIDELDECNHHEADTRLVCIAAQSSSPVIIRATDTDILVLMVNVYSKLQSDQSWQMKIDNERYVSIGAICDHYGKDACKILPAFHSITGSDTSSYPYRIGKVRPWKKLLKGHSYDLLSTFGHGTLSASSLCSAKDFLRRIMYTGQKNESYIETRVRIYQKQSQVQ